tara:strand:- start:51 stop:356 length:306 start_codon:yes stop_codon:yes gene_type:complete
MTRYRLKDGQRIQFTAEEEKLRDAEEKAWNDDAPNRRMTELRRQRDVLLAETDWIVIKARESNATVPSAWKTYRQALRDLTTQTPTDDALSNITFPEKPTE